MDPIDRGDPAHRGRQMGEGKVKVEKCTAQHWRAQATRGLSPTADRFLLTAVWPALAWFEFKLFSCFTALAEFVQNW